MLEENGKDCWKFMIQPKEDISCYASPQQREVLLKVLDLDPLKKDFFLTGGTALAVFYLHHRESNDLDLFTFKDVELGEIDFLIKTTWANQVTKLKDSSTFLSLLVKDVKLDFVIDRLSQRGERTTYFLADNVYLQLDSLANILSNKLTALASRNEPKDFVDFYFLYRGLEAGSFDSVYHDAGKKDAIFDDPPTAAYQIEQGLDFVLQNQSLLPRLKINFELDDFISFYHDMISWIYKRITP